MFKLHWLAGLGLGLTVALTGCGGSDDEDGFDISAFLEEHAKALKAENVDDASKNHAATSRLQVYNQATQIHEEKEGIDGVKAFYTELFKSGDLSKLEMIQTKGHDRTDGTSASAFVVWKCADCNIPEATETMIFNEENKILRHTLVYQWTEGSGVTSGVIDIGTGKDTAVSKAWKNHFDAFGGQDVDKIMADYDDSSVVYVFNHASQQLTENRGKEEIKTLFTGLFKSLPAANDVGAPVQLVREKEDGSPYVFLVWESPNNGYARATDTFVFSTANPAIIKVQYVVVNHAPEAHVATLNAHWSAFKSQNVTESRAGYADSAQVSVFEQTVGRYENHTGEAIDNMYTKLFAAIGTSGVDIKKRWAYNKASGNGASSFMVWSCGTCGIKEGTETLIFDDVGKIVRHTFVFLEDGSTGASTNITEVVGDKETPVSKAWDNHFTAFGGGDGPKIAGDYDNSSIVHVYNHHDGSETIHKGRAEVQAMFADVLFPSLTTNGSIQVSAVPVQYVEEATGGNVPHVFLTWASTSKGYARATDTFVFDSATPAIIKRQYVVVNYVPNSQSLFIV